MKTIELVFDSNVITLEVDLIEKVGSIKSNLKGEEDEDYDYNCAIDGIESLILAQCLNGIDIENENYIDSIKTSVNAVAENL